MRREGPDTEIVDDGSPEPRQRSSVPPLHARVLERYDVGRCLGTGTFKSSCELTGNADSMVLYNLVGADVYLAGAPIAVSSAIESLPTFQVDPTASKVRMVRIDGQYGAPNWMVDPTKPGAACATIISKANLL